MASFTTSRVSTLVQRATAAPRAARKSVTVRAGPAGNWLPGTPAPSHLESSSLPGNFGFDPLNLGANPETLKWYAQAELQHARWAMLGAAGVLAAEFNGQDWVAAQTKTYWADTKVLVAIQFFLFAWVEMRRLQDIRKPNSASDDPIFTNNKLPPGEVGYPGGIFDPMGMSKGNMEELKLKEIKNGRLAMLATLGFLAQHVATGKGALEGLSSHIASPYTTTCLSHGCLPFPPFN